MIQHIIGKALYLTGTSSYVF